MTENTAPATQAADQRRCECAPSLIGDRAKTVRSLLALAEYCGVAFPAALRLYSSGILSMDMDDAAHAEAWCRAFMVASRSHIYEPDDNGVIVRIVSGATSWRGWRVQWQAAEEVGRVTPASVVAAALTPDAADLPDGDH